MERIRKINTLIRKSLEYAYENPQDGKDYIRNLAQETSDDVIQKHIDLYVNDYSLSLGNSGRKAIEVLFTKSEKASNAGPSENLFFIP